MTTRFLAFFISTLLFANNVVYARDESYLQINETLQNSSNVTPTNSSFSPTYPTKAPTVNITAIIVFSSMFGGPLVIIGAGAACVGIMHFVCSRCCERCWESPPLLTDPKYSYLTV